tara:strand:- start:99 stop:359 length:261 start_codon:yes stop_codon:yes gene_type:complete
MDNYINNDNNNPINWDGENKICSECSEELTMNDYENICNNCFNKEEPTEEEKEVDKLEKNLKAQRETLNAIFDSFSLGTIDTLENK